MIISLYRLHQRIFASGYFKSGPEWSKVNVQVVKSILRILENDIQFSSQDITTV